MRYSIKYSLNNVAPTNIVVGSIMAAIGGTAIVLGYKFASRGFEEFARGVGFRVSKKT